MSDERRFGRYGHFGHPHHFPMWKNGVFSGLDVHEPQDTTLVSDLPRHIRETRRALTAIKVLHVNFEAGVERGDLVFPDMVTDTWLRAHSDVPERQRFYGIAFPEDRAVVVSDLVLCPDWNWEPGRALYLSDLYGKMSYVERGTLAGYAITKHLVMLNIFGQHTASMISDFENWLLNQKIEIINMYNQIVQMYGDIQAIYDDIKRISDKVYLESGVYNVRAATVMNTMIPSGSVVTLPAYYYPKRNTLYLAYESNVCVPSNVGIESLYTYSEVGTNPNELSNKITVNFDIEPGSTIDVWVVTSALGKNLDAMEELLRDAQGIVEAATEQADRAQNEADEADSDANRAEDAARRAEEAASQVAVSTGAYNEEAAWINAQAIPAGSTITLPIMYNPGRRVLSLSYDGIQCYQSAIGEGSAFQYDEVGTDPNTRSNQIVVRFDVEAGSFFHAWVVTSGIGNVTDELLALQQDVRQNAQSSIISADSAMSSANAASGSAAAALASANAASASASASAASAVASEASKIAAENLLNNGFDASKVVSGVFDIDRIPVAALSREVLVQNDTERLALTKGTGEGQVTNGDTVYVTDTMKYYRVVNDESLNTEDGYIEYSMSVDWNTIKSRPETFTPSPHASTHAPGGSDPLPGGGGSYAAGNAAIVVDETARTIGVSVSPDGTARGLSVTGTGLSINMAQANGTPGVVRYATTTNSSIDDAAVTPSVGSQMFAPIGTALENQSGTRELTPPYESGRPFPRVVDQLQNLRNVCKMLLSYVDTFGTVNIAKKLETLRRFSVNDGSDVEVLLFDGTSNVNLGIQVTVPEVSASDVLPGIEKTVLRTWLQTIRSNVLYAVNRAKEALLRSNATGLGQLPAVTTEAQWTALISAMPSYSTKVIFARVTSGILSGANVPPATGAVFIINKFGSGGLCAIIAYASSDTNKAQYSTSSTNGLTGWDFIKNL